MKVIGIIIVCIIIGIFLILPPGGGKMPLFYDENGEVISESISKRVYLNIDGEDIGLFIRGKNIEHPVLLFLGGGPGIPQYILEQEYPTQLEEKFVVCYVEYRGTSISYDKDMQAAQMTTKQYISDIVNITKYLQERFEKEKVYLLGHSFGTYLGLLAVHQYPELYHAYIAMSQMTNQLESEKIAYKYMLEAYKKAGNNKRAKQLEQQDIFGSNEVLKTYSRSFLRDQSMHELGIGTTRDMQSIISGIVLPSLKCKIYTPMERLQIWTTRKFVSKYPVIDESRTFNAFYKITSLQTPIYFFGGTQDYTCCYCLQKNYYEILEAPLKKFYSFDSSAHSPLFEEPEKAINILIKDVLQSANN